MERDHGGIGAYGYVANILLANRRVHRTSEADLALLPVRQHFKFEGAIIQRFSSGACPLLLALRAFGHRPNFIATIVDPAMLSGLRRQVLPLERIIDEQEVMATEGHLHKPSAELGNDLQLYPWIGHLLSLPSQVGGLLNRAARRCSGEQGLAA